MRHYYWHDPIGRDYYAVCFEAGILRSAWLQVGPRRWSALDDFEPLLTAISLGELHRNPYGFTDTLAPSREAEA